MVWDHWEWYIHFSNWGLLRLWLLGIFSIWDRMLNWVAMALTLPELWVYCKHSWPTASLPDGIYCMFYTLQRVIMNVAFYSMMNTVSIRELQWFLMQLDEEQADSAVGADRMARLGLWMPHLIYGCMKCRVRSFHRKNELPRGNKKVMVIVCPLVTSTETSLHSSRWRKKK